MFIFDCVEFSFHGEDERGCPNRKSQGLHAKIQTQANPAKQIVEVKAGGNAVELGGGPSFRELGSKHNHHRSSFLMSTVFLRSETSSLFLRKKLCNYQIQIITTSAQDD